ncbi:pyridoxal-phosphate dependent enzyme [Streptomyces sp. NPDC004539]|uniref:pyridoxal-phosphate dependent enzyme n=1 Tax=Streptomyces sp. NPDC004539 TaxID=3154280 RepID=UPI0033A3C69D
MLFDSVVDTIGHTPLVRLRDTGAPGVDVYAKLELQNLFGMKDRVARTMILEARRTGALREGAPIIESSSGTMALGIALVGTSLGHDVHIVTDPRIDEVTLAKLHALGCRVHVVEAMSAQGWQSARLEALDRLLAELPGAFWPQQYSNPDNPGAYRQLAAEILADLGPVDVLVGSVGSGGSLCGTARALKESLPALKVVGVDAVGSVLFGQPDLPGRRQSGLGNSLLPKNLDRRLIDEVHWLSDAEAFASTRALAREQQIFAGNTSGSVYRVLGDLAARAEPGTRIVGILPDRGDRYTDTVHSDAYWAREGLREQDTAPAPRLAAPGQVVHGWSRRTRDGDGTGGLTRRLLFVESNTTGTGMLALETARRLGAEPVLLTSAPERYAGLADTECEVLRCDTNSLPELRRHIQDRFRREEIAGITTTSDFYVPVVADLAGWLGLPGNPVAAVAACRDKSALRRLLAEAGVPQPRFAAVTAVAEVAGAVDAVGLPCVVKPADESGSTNVRLCATVAEAERQTALVLAAEVNARGLPTAGVALVEEYLEGPEYSVELFGLRGETRCVGITEKSVTGAPYFVEHRHLFPAPLSPALARQVEDVARRAVHCAGIGLGATHTEVRLTADGPAIVEVNARMAGGMIPELVRLATGTRLLDQHLRAALGLPPEPFTEPVRHAGIQFLLADRAGELTGFTGVEAARDTDGVHQVTVTARPGTAVRPPRDAYDRLGHVIVSGDSPTQVVKACAEAVGLLTPEIRTAREATAR